MLFLRFCIFVFFILYQKTAVKSTKTLDYYCAILYNSRKGGMIMKKRIFLEDDGYTEVSEDEKLFIVGILVASVV